MSHPLEALGWTRRFEESFAPYRAQGLAPGRVALPQRGAWVVLTAHGETTARLSGRLRRDARGAADLPAVGDWVVLRRSQAAGSRAFVAAVLPRASAFVRKVAGDAAEEQVVAANVDTVLLVTAVGQDLNPRRLERYLALAWESGARPVVIVSKADLDSDAEATGRQVASVAAGVPVHRVSNVTGEGLDEVRAYLQPGRTVALLGSSGVGKSTLVNALLGSDRQRTAEVGRIGKGRHATTQRELMVVPGGGLLIDTPGLREIQLWESGAGMAAAFPEIDGLAAACRFRDCQHESEPGCAVAAAAAAGALAGDRLESYRRLRAELRHLEARTTERARAAKKQTDRMTSRALSERIRMKDER